jgi:microcin C transport system permease protein
MARYLVRRILLMVPTFFGTTFLVFVILSFVPGGPFERAVMQLKQSEMQTGGKMSGETGMRSGMLSPEILERLRRQYGLDKPVWVRYLVWLGLWKRELKEKTASLGEAFREDLRYVRKGNRLFAVQRWVKPVEENGRIQVLESGVGSDFEFSKDYDVLPPEDMIIDWEPSRHWEAAKLGQERVRLVKRARSGIFTGDLGRSYVYDEPVSRLIRQRLHISCYFGFLGFALSYLVCIPLGIMKALRQGSRFDWISSLLVFIGYAIPGYVLGALLLVLLGGGSFWNVFPLGGFVSGNFDSLSPTGKIMDLLHHTVLPVIAYMVGSFATLTVLMKNSLLENLGRDYVRTAFAKGLSEKRVIWVHVLRNSLIPVATGIGHVIGIFLAGSYLIEKVFNIDGIGMLSFRSVISADYPVVMGFLVINTAVLLVGNLLSDMAYAAIDPRIRFD